MYMCNACSAVGIYVENQAGNITVRSSEFLNNNGKQGSLAALAALLASRFEMVNTSFYSNSGTGTAGAVFIGRISDAGIMQTTFEDNRVQCGTQWKFCGGSAIQLSQGSRLLVKQCLFIRNKAHSGPSHGGAIYVHGGSELLVTSSSFKDNSAAFGGAISAQDGSKLSIDPPWFDEFCGCVGHARLYLTNWKPFIMAVKNHWGEGYYFDVVDAHSEEEPPINLEHFLPTHGTEFSNNSAFSGGAVMVAFSSLLISSMNIERDIPCGCRGSRTGLSTRFEGNVAFTGGAITSLGYKAHTVLMNVIIINNTALGATPLNVSRMETMTNITYTDDISTSESFKGGCGLGGGGGMCLSCGENSLQRKCMGSISGTIFQANSADYGGGLYVTADENACSDPDECYTIHITRIIQTFPTPSASLRLSQNTNVTAQDAFKERAIFIPVFPDNQITWDGESFYQPGLTRRNYTEDVDGSATLFTQNAAVGGAGGAIYMEQMTTINITCDTVEVSHANSTYGGEYNDYVFYGLPLNVTTKHDTYLPCYSWTMNTANMGFGDILATSPTSMTIYFSPKPYQRLVGGGSYQFTSGDDLRFNVSLTDFWGRQYIPSVLSAKAMLTLEISAQAYTSSSQEEATAPPTLVWRSMDTTFSFRASPGPHSVIVTPAPSALGRYFQPYVLNVYVLPCKLGEYDPVWDAGYRCVLCDVGSYRVDEDLTECKVCPQYATCVNNTSFQPNADNPIIVPDTGYFHSNPFSNQLYQCDDQSVVTPCAYSGRHDRIVEYQLTLLNDTNKYNETEYYKILCAPGYSGVLCSRCANGYGLAAGGCQECMGRHAAHNVSSAIVEGGEKEHEIKTDQSDSEPGHSLHQDSSPEKGGTKHASLFEDPRNDNIEDAPSEQCAITQPAQRTPYLERAQQIGATRSGAGEDEQCTPPQPAQQTSPLERVQQIGEKRSGAQEAEQCTPPEPAQQTSPLERAKRIGSQINRTQEAGFITLAATWKIFVTYLQSLLMMRWIQKNNSLLPTSFSKLLGGVEAIFSSTTSFLSKECAISGEYVVDRRVLMTIVAATFPLMVYVAISMYYLLFPMFHRLLASLTRMPSSDRFSTESAPFKWPDYATKMTTSALVVLFYYYPTWIQVFLEMFLCYTINFEDSAEETQLARASGLHYGPRWSFNFDLQCYEGQHAVMVYTMGIAGLIFIVSTPIVMAWHLFANAYQLDSPRFRMTFGFLYEEYHYRYGMSSKNNVEEHESKLSCN
eukprot:gene26535-18365_t